MFTFIMLLAGLALLALAAWLEALRIKEIADAEGYQRERLMRADNALQMRLDAMIQMNKDTWSAIGQAGVPIVPNFVGGGGDGASSAADLIALLTANTAQAVANAAGD